MKKAVSWRLISKRHLPEVQVPALPSKSNSFGDTIPDTAIFTSNRDVQKGRLSILSADKRLYTPGIEAMLTVPPALASEKKRGAKKGTAKIDGIA